MLRMDIGFYIGPVLWPLLESSFYGFEAPVASGTFASQGPVGFYSLPTGP